MALWAYAASWVLGLPAIVAYLAYRARRDPDYARHLGERFGRHAPMPGAVWVHAVSLGEVRSAVPLVRGLLGQGERVVLTHFTPAGRRETARTFAPEIAEGRVRAAWVPFELSLCFDAFFRAFTPKYGLVMEIEVWPEMILSARRSGIPLLMCNAQYPSRSFDRDRGGLRAELMRGFAGALVKSQRQADRFASVGVEPIAITGELRFDQPLPAAQIAAGRAARPARTVIAFASVVEGEDAGFMCVVKALHDEADAGHEPRPLILYIPRKPERFDAVAALLTRAGFAVRRRSQAFGTDLLPLTALDGTDVLLGDSLGEMYFYLAMADRAVVGGGFTSGGSHNIAEALALGLDVLTGPDTHTIEYPFEEALAAGVARAVPDYDALGRALIAPSQATKDRIEAFFADHSGATRRTLDAIPALLATSRRNRRPR